MALTMAPFRLPETPAEPDLLAKYFRALGTPARLAILEILAAEGELSVGQLVDRLHLPQPALSNHLACLRWCGFVVNRRDFRTVYYKLVDERVIALIAIARSLLRENADRFGPAPTRRRPRPMPRRQVRCGFRSGRGR